MNLRTTLKAMIGAFVLIGLIFVAYPFGQSLFLTEEKTSALRVKIPLAQIPPVGAYQVDFRHYKAFAVRTPEFQVFVMPYWDEAYRLPDPHWERSMQPCKYFVVSESGFSCEDPSIHQSWNEEATWDTEGKNLGTWMPDLQTREFRIEGQYLILDP